MPTPGWYPDPEQDSTWRWWDGTAWTELRSPMWDQTTTDTSTSFSSWFDRSFSGVRAVVRRFGLVVFGVWAALGVAATVLAVAVFESDRGRELRELLGDDLSTAASSTGLTDEEADRALELLGEIFWSVLPWGIVLVLVYTVVGAGTYALAAQVAAAGSVEQAVAEEPVPSVRSALRRVPAVIAASLVLGAISVGVLVVVSLPVVLVAISDASGAAIGLTVFFCVIAGLVIGVWLWVRLGLSAVGAALGGHGLGIGRSWTLTDGRYWFVFGRLLVAGLIAGALGGATNIIGQFVGLFGVVAGLTLLLLLTTIVDALRTIVSASAHAAILDQVDRIDLMDDTSG
jgi:hypothetical protein